MNSEEYLKERVQDQIDWYDKKSTTNQRWYKRLRGSEFVMAAFIPFLAGFAGELLSAQVAVGLLGAGVAIVTATIGLNQFQENWVAYRTTCESLKKEKFMFTTGTKPYDGDQGEAFTLLVQRVETLVSKENTNWSDYMMNPVEKDEG